MAEVAEKVKDAVLPSGQTVKQAVTAGVTAFGGFALTGAIANRVEPRVSEMLGDTALPVISNGSISRVATAAVANLGHMLIKDTEAGKAGFMGVEVRDLTFWSVAGAYANAFGSLLVDVIDQFGGDSEAVDTGEGYIRQLTGLPSAS